MFPLSKDLVNKSITLVTDLVSQPRMADVAQAALGFILHNVFSLFTTTVATEQHIFRYLEHLIKAK